MLLENVRDPSTAKVVAKQTAKEGPIPREDDTNILRLIQPYPKEQPPALTEEEAETKKYEKTEPELAPVILHEITQQRVDPHHAPRPIPKTRKDVAGGAAAGGDVEANKKDKKDDPGLAQ